MIKELAERAVWRCVALLPLVGWRQKDGEARLQHPARADVGELAYQYMRDPRDLVELRMILRTVGLFLWLS